MVTTMRASTLTGYAELARTVGLDPLRMLQEVGLSSAALEDPDLRISTTAVRALLANSARVAEDFALRLAERRTPSIWGAVTLVAREQPTLRTVIVAAIRYTALQDEAAVIQLEEQGDVAILSIAETSTSASQARQALEMGVSQLVRLLRGRLGPEWRPLSVCLAYPPPRSLDTHRRVLGPNLEFNRDFNGVVFDRADLDRANPTADPKLAREVERYADNLMGPAVASVADRARTVVLGSLRTGRCSIEDTAERLDLDVRTLQRRLADEGTGFLDIVQQARTYLADQYVPHSDRPLLEVAELLGFSALSAFSRWHKAHYGCSPSARRSGEA